MASVLNFNAFSSGGWNRRRWWWHSYNATATGLENQVLITSVDTLNISATAIARRWGTGRATGVANSKIFFGGSNINISAYARGRDAYAVGMLGSLIQACGCDNKTININAKSRVFSYDPAWGMQRSAILTGSGNDSINITADAGYANRWGRRSGSLILAKGMESSLLNTGSGDDVITINAIADGDRRSVANAIGIDQNSQVITGEGNDKIYVTADATGVQSNAWAIRNSYIDTGKGDDLVSLTAKTWQTGWRRDPAYGAENSSIKLGKGDDQLIIKSQAGGVGDLRAYGAVGSLLDAGSGDDTVNIDVSANGGRGERSHSSYAYSRSRGGSWGYTRKRQWDFCGNWGRNRYWGSYRRSYASQGNYETSYQSKYNYSYNYDYSSSSVDRRDGRAFGLLNSKLELGSGADNATLKIQGNNEAKGLAGSVLLAGNGADSISIDVLANGERSYQSKGSSSYSYSRESKGFSKGSRSYSHDYDYSSRWGWNSSSNYEGSSSWDRTWDNVYKRERESTWNRKNINRFGVAIGAENSSLDLGKGADDLIINASGGETAYALSSSSITAGKGNDSINLTATAEGENSYINQSDYSYCYLNSSKSSWDSSGEYSRSYNYGYRNWYSGYGNYTGKYQSTGSYEYTRSYDYSRNYDSSRINRYGSAIGALNSTIDAGSGDDELTISATGGHEATAVKGSDITLGAGHDSVELTSLAEGEYGYRYANEGSYSRSGSYSYRNSGEYDYSGSYGYSYGRWGGRDRSYSYSRSYDYSYSRDYGNYSRSWGYSYDGGLQSTGIAKGLESSKLDTGKGDDSVLIDAIGSRQAIGLDQSTLDTGKGHDTVDLIAEALDDSKGIAFGLKDSCLHTGSGDDSIYIAALGAQQQTALSNSTINTGNGADYLTVEGDIKNSKISMGKGDDTVDLFGGGKSLTYAGAGDDAITGGDGNDTMYGEYGHDTLTGNKGNDSIYGGKGNDLIDGGTGVDLLYGGCGSDTFILNCGDGYATITDFEVGSDTLMFADTTNIRMEFRNSDSLFYSGLDYLGVAKGVELSEQKDGSFV